MNTINTSRILDEISQAYVPSDVDLLPGILARVDARPEPAPRPAARLTLTALAMLVALSILFLAVPGAATAMRKLLGFIPGVGQVDQTVPLRVLAGPAADARDGFTLTVEQAVADAERTTVVYKLEGPFGSRPGVQPGGVAGLCFASAQLRLPDGTSFDLPQAFPDETWPNGYRVKAVYPALPGGVDRAALVLPCLHALPTGQGPQAWELPLLFVPAPPELTVYPLSQPATPAAPTAEAPSAASTEAGQPARVRVSLESVVPAIDGQLVQVRLDWSADPRIAGVNLRPEDVKITDANGANIAFEPSDEAVDPAAAAESGAVFGFKTAPVTAPGPARLTVTALAEVNYRAEAAFTFDPGPDRQPQQTWELNKDLTLDGRTLRIKSVTITEMDGNASVEFDMQSPDGILGAGVSDTAHPAMSGMSMQGDGVGTLQQFASGINYDGGLPAGPLTFTVGGYTLRQPGPWDVEWTPAPLPTPAANLGPIPQGPCLTEADWKTAQQHPLPIPAGVAGRLLVEQDTADPNVEQLALMNLDGSDVKVVADNGIDAAVSPDGRRAAFLGPEGVTVVGLEDGSRQVLPGTGDILGVFRVFWPSHGPRLAYTGTPGGSSPNIYLTDLNGSLPRLALPGSPILLMQGWQADGHILFVGYGPTGLALQRLNPVSGEVTSLFNVPQLTTPVSLSRDGGRLATVWQEEQQGKQTLYAMTLDGSQRKPLLEMTGDGYIRSMVWSPDGRWLLVDLSWVLPETYTKALVNVETCELVPLPAVDGLVDDWTR